MKRIKLTVLKNRSDTLVDCLVGVAGQIETWQLASKTVALEIAAVLVAQRTLSPWAGAPVDTLGCSAVPAPVNVGLGQDLEESRGFALLWLASHFGHGNRRSWGAKRCSGN